MSLCTPWWYIKQWRSSSIYSLLWYWMEVTGQFHALATLLPGKYPPGNNWTEGGTDSTACLRTLENRTFRARESNHECSLAQPVPQSLWFGTENRAYISINRKCIWKLYWTHWTWYKEIWHISRQHIRTYRSQSVPTTRFVARIIRVSNVTSTLP